MEMSCMPYEMVDFSDEAVVEDWLDYAGDMLDGVDVLGVDSETPWRLIAFYMRKVQQEGLRIAMMYPRHTLIEDMRNPGEEANRRTAARIRHDMELAKELNVCRLRYCVNPGYHYFAGVDFDINYDRLVKDTISVLQDVLPLAEEGNIKLLIENHPDEISTRKAFFDSLFRQIQSPCLGINFDMVNTLFYRDQRPEDFIRDPAIFERIYGLHVDNLGSVGGYSGKFAIDNGRLDVPALLREIRDAGYDGWLTFEYSGHEREEISRSIELIRKVWAEQ